MRCLAPLNGNLPLQNATAHGGDIRLSEIPMEFQFEAIGPALRGIVLVFLILFALIALALIVLLAALPGQIAKRRGHPQVLAVSLCGWLGLPTGLLWVVALIWATWDYSDKVTLQLDKQLAELEHALSELEAQIQGA